MVRLVALICFVFIGQSTFALAKLTPAEQDWVNNQIHYANQLLEQEKYPNAEKVLRQLYPIVSSSKTATSNDRVLGSTAFLMGRLAYHQQQFERAVEYLAVARKHLQGAEQAKADTLLGSIYMAQGQLSKALPLLPQPSHFDGWLQRAQILASLKLFEQAALAMEQAFRFNPKPDEATREFALSLYWQLPDKSKAIRLLKQITARSLEPKYWNYLLQLYEQQGEPKKVLATLELAYRKGLWHDHAGLVRLVDTYHYQGQPYIGAKYLETWLDTGKLPDKSEYWLKLAKLWLAAKEDDAAIAAYTRLAQLTGDSQWHVQVASISMVHQRWDKAQASLERALDKAQSKGPIYLMLGEVAFESGQQDQARRWFNQAVQQPESQSSAKEWLAFLSENESSP
jgi:tetratricopeptide (TPR) repeat protein